MDVTSNVTSMCTMIERLYHLSEDQAGHFTAAQAQRAGISRRMLSHYVSSGMLSRVAHGLYRLTLFPAQRFEDLITVALWAGAHAAISHDSALMVYDLGGAMPPVIHVTVPTRFRGRRAGVVVHWAPIDANERTVRDGVPVTSVERTLADVARTADPSLARQAAQEALQRGLTTRRRLGQALDRYDQSRLILVDTLGPQRGR